MHIDPSSPLVDPRRSPRFTVRCQVRGEAGGRPFPSETEDLGLHGCQLVLPWPLDGGLPVRLVVAYPSLPEALRVSGRVAWCGAHAPWRHGVVFDAESLPASTRWLARLTALHPELTASPRVPAALAAEAVLHLGEPPRFVIDFSEAELTVLRQVRDGITAGALRRRLAARWEPSLRALFSLLHRRAVTLDPAQAAHPLAWVEPLGAVERSIAPGSASASLGRLRLRAAPEASEG